MFKKIILILAILAVLTAGALFYVNKVLLPVQIKGMLVKAAEESLNRKVSLDSLQYTLLNGFVLDNLTIYSRENPEEVFVHIDRASTQVFFPGLVQKKIILPSVRLVNLSARVIRFNADTWNFSDLIAPKPGTATDSAQAAPPDIVIGGFSVSNARIKLTDLVGGDSFSEMFEPVNLTGSLALPASLRVTGDIHIPSTRGSAVFAVRMGIKNRNLKADIELNNILAGKYLRFIPEGINVPVKALTITRLKTTVSADNNAVTVTGALLLNNINAEPLPGMKARGSLGLNNLFFTADKNSVNLKAAIDLKDAALETPDGRKFKASCKTTETRFTLKNTDWTLSTDATLTGASALLGEGQNIEGDITLSKLSVRQAKDQGLHAQGDLVLNHFSARLPGVLVNAALLASGSTLEFRDDTIDIKARPIFNSLDISLPGATPENRGMSFKGAPAASVHAVIPVKGQTPSYDATVELKNGLFTGAPVVGAISAIRASLQIRTDEALIRNMSFSVFDTPVTASGEVHGFASPRLDLNAKAKDVDLALVQKIIPQIIQDNELLVTGRMDISAEIKGQAVELATKGIKAVATLKDTAVDSGKLKQSLRNISGILTYNAPDLSWKDLSIGFQGKTYLLNGRIQNLANPLITTSLKTENITADARVKKTGDGFTIDSLSAAWFD